jgi:predicted nucleic acid-binding protein
LRVLVSDTSVIIDLERGSLLQDVFQLPFEFAVPDLLFRRELQGPLGAQLTALGLRVEELTPDEVTRATSVRRANLALSVPDAFAFSLATVRGWMLLTGDGGLRQLAGSTGLSVHGVLWLLDQIGNRSSRAEQPIACWPDSHFSASPLSPADSRRQKAPQPLCLEVKGMKRTYPREMHLNLRPSRQDIEIAKFFSALRAYHKPTFRA